MPEWPHPNPPEPSFLFARPESPVDATSESAPLPVDPPAEDLEHAKNRLWDDLTKLYIENAETIDRATEADPVQASLDGGQHLQRALENFSETAKVVSEALVALGNIHPAIGVAVFAFHSVISLDVSRRDNERKVLVVKVQMQSMMCALFQLRHLRLKHFGDEKDPSRGELHALMKSIASEIKECGSDLTYFREKSTIKKFLKAKLYENRFAEHTQIFSQRRSELQTLLATYAVSGISVVIQKQTEANDKLKNIENKVDFLVENLFRKLDTPQEVAVATFIESNGGPRECLEKDDIFRRLLVIAGQPISRDAASSEGGSGLDKASSSGLGSVSKGVEGSGDVLVREGSSLEQLRKTRKELTADLEMDLKKAFRDHQTRFEAMLKVQDNNLQRISDQLSRQGAVVNDANSKMDQVVTMSLMILEEGKLIKKAVLPARLSKVHLKDPMLQELWERMGLKANVKAKHFVLGLRDHLLYHTDLMSNPNSMPATPAVQAFDSQGLPSNTPEFRARLLGRTHQPAPNLIRIQSEERWILQYLDVLHVQPILEAMDEDGSGFISVREANRFAIARPAECSLLGWLAYWAAGWHLTLTTYRSKIYHLLQQMHAKHCPPSSTKWNTNFDLHFFANRNAIEEYLAGPLMGRLDMLLRSTRPSPRGLAVDQHLLTLATTIARAKEQRLKDNLRDLGYVIRSVQDARLVIGVDRIEAAIYPLLYLLLEHHLEIMNLSSHCFLAENELQSHRLSLAYVFALFDERIVTLKATFLQVHFDVDRRFETFAYGMFFTTLKEKDNWPLMIHTDESSILHFSAFNEPLGLHDNTSNATEPESPQKAQDLSILTEAPDKRPDIPPVDQDVFRNAMRHRSLGFVRECEGGSAFTAARSTHPQVEDGTERNREEDDEHASSTLSSPRPTTPATPQLSVRQSMCGYWTLANVYPDPDSVSFYRLWHCVLSPGPSPGSIVGTGESMCGPMSIRGMVWRPKTKPDRDQASEETIYPFRLTATVLNDLFYSVRISGTYNTETDELRGSFVYFDADEEPDPTPAEDITRSTPDGNCEDLPDNTSIPGQGNGPSSGVKDAGFSSIPELRNDELPVLADDEELELEGVEFHPGATVISSRTPVQFCRFKKASFLATTPTPLPTDTTEAVPQPSPARRRWNFACQCVRYHVQEKMNSKSFVNDRLLERRKWIDLSMRYKFSRYLGPDTGRRAQFPPDAWNDMNELRSIVPPCNSRLYDSTASFFAKREVRAVGWYTCDICATNLNFSERHHCITCVKDDYWTQVDICLLCLDKSYVRPDTDYIDHSPLHSLVRTRTMMNYCDTRDVIVNAKEKATRVKQTFRQIEKEKEGDKVKQIEGATSKGGLVGGQIQSNITHPRCGCCGEELELPCWMCLECDHDTFFCVRCDKDHRPLSSGFKEGEIRHPSYEFHTTIHHLLFIRTSQAISGRKPTPKTEVAKLDKRLEDIEGRLKMQLTTLEQQFAERVKTIEDKMSQIEQKIEDSARRVEERMTMQTAQTALVEEKMNAVIALLQKLTSTPGAGPNNGDGSQPSGQ